MFGTSAVLECQYFREAFVWTETKLQLVGQTDRRDRQATLRDKWV